MAVGTRQGARIRQYRTCRSGISIVHFRRPVPWSLGSLVPCFSHTGGKASITGTPFGAVKWNASGGTGAFGISPVNVKLVMAPSISSISMAVIAPSLVTVSVIRGMRFSCPFGWPVRVNSPLGAGLSVSWVSSFSSSVWPSRKRSGERRSSSFLASMPLYLGVALGIEPRVFSVQQEELSRRRGVVPAHAAGLAQQKRAALLAVHAQAGIALRKAGLERMQLVVVLVDALGERVGIGVLRGPAGLLAGSRQR